MSAEKESTNRIDHAIRGAKTGSGMRSVGVLAPSGSHAPKAFDMSRVDPKGVAEPTAVSPQHVDASSGVLSHARVAEVFDNVAFVVLQVLPGQIAQSWMCRDDHRWPAGRPTT